MTGFVAAAAVALKFVVADGDPTRVVVAAEGITDPSAGLTLHLVGDEGGIGPEMFGHLGRHEGAIHLRPVVKLSRGATYRAVLRREGKEPVAADYKVPVLESPAPGLAEIFPTGRRLPANLLKFYLYFDQPMREGREIFEQIHIEEESGRRVHDPWRWQELWTDDARRLTLWVHPGRVKRGVRLREELGPVLLPDRRYTLVVDPTVRSAAGKPLGREVRHAFTTSAEDHDRPLPETWRLTVPRAGTRGPLRVESPEPLDHALIWKLVRVRDPGGKQLPVTVDVDEGERRWSMLPADPWAEGEHRLIIGETLEDLAGNTPLRVFDNDLTLPQGKPGARWLPFRPEE